MNGFPIITTLTLLPLLGAVLVIALGETKGKFARGLALGVSLVSLALALAVSLGALGLGGCERHESASAYDPELDGVQPKSSTPDLAVFDNQAELYKKIAPPPAPPPVPVQVPTTAPATAPGDNVPAAPDAVPAAPAAPGDAAPPPPPPPN